MRPDWTQNDHMCYLPAAIAKHLTYGREEIDGFEAEHAQCVFLWGANPAITWPNTQRVKATFQRLDFMVVMDLYLTATARLADIVLPAASQFEKDQLIAFTAPFGVDKPTWYLSLRRQVVDPGERRSDWWFWKELGHRMGYGAHYPWADDKEAIDHLILNAGRKVAVYTHSRHRNLSRLRRAVPEPLAEIHLAVVNLVHGWEEANANVLKDHLDTGPVLATPSVRAGLCQIRGKDNGQD